jgi:hypothetical protein
MLVGAQGREQHSCACGGTPGFYQHACKVQAQAGVVRMLSEACLEDSLGFLDCAAPVQGLREHSRSLAIIWVLLEVLSQDHYGGSEVPCVPQPGCFRHGMCLARLLTGGSFDRQECEQTRKAQKQ